MVHRLSIIALCGGHEEYENIVHSCWGVIMEGLVIFISRWTLCSMYGFQLHHEGVRLRIIPVGCFWCQIDSRSFPKVTKASG